MSNVDLPSDASESYAAVSPSIPEQREEYTHQFTAADTFIAQGQRKAEDVRGSFAAHSTRTIDPSKRERVGDISTAVAFAEASIIFARPRKRRAKKDHVILLSLLRQ